MKSDGTRGEDVAGSWQRVLVTGGAGFLGAHLGQALLAAGAEVICVDNFLTSPPASIARLTGLPRFSVREGPPVPALCRVRHPSRPG